jgi:diguanylate cyclase (GGDEF)-like protein/PAS domain S-box-containing protein
MKPDPPRQFKETVLFALAYFVSTRLSMAIAHGEPNSIVVWLPSGLALSAMLVVGPRIWPGMLVGGLTAMACCSLDAPAVVSYAVANLICPLLGWWLATRLFPISSSLERATDVIRLFVPVALLSGALSALAGTTIVQSFSSNEPNPFLQQFLVWWLGDSTGIAVVVPLVLVWRNVYRTFRPQDTLILFPCALAMSLFLVSGYTQWSYDVMKFATLITAIACSVVGSRRVVTLAILAIAIAAMTGTALTTTPSTNEVATRFVMSQQGYVYAVALIMLSLAVSRKQWHLVENQLRQINERLAGLLRLSTEWHWELDADGRLINLSPSRAGGNELSTDRAPSSEPHSWQPALRLSEPIYSTVFGIKEPFHDLIHREITADGKIRHYTINGEPVFDRRELITGYRGVARDVSEQIEKALQHNHSRQLFLTIFSGSPTPLIISRLSDGRHFEVNQATLDQFGYSRDEMIGKSTAEMGAWNSESDRAAILKTLSTEGRISGYEIKLRRRSGELADVLYSAQLIDFDGEPCIITTLHDISERRRAQLCAIEYEQRFTKIFHSTPNAVVISRLADGQYIEINDAWCTLCAYDRDELLRSSSIKLNIWADTGARTAFVQRLSAGERISDFEFRVRRKDGLIIDTLLSGDLIELNGDICVVSIMVDITERHKDQQRLRESEQRFFDVIDASGEYVWETDLDGKYTYVSLRSQSVLGVAPGKLLGHSIFDFICPQERPRLAQLFDQSTNNPDGKATGEFSHRRNGNDRWQRLSWCVVRSIQDSSVVGYRGVGEDITERRNTSAVIEQLATHDPLTGLPNRRLLQDRLSQGLTAAERDGKPLALLFIDLDSFKLINDSLGHATGDMLLQQVVTRLSGVIRRGDTLARLGGDEFVVLQRGINRANDASRVAQKILTLLSSPIEVDGHMLSTSASIGISVFPADAQDSAGLMKCADMAMYAAKDLGRNNFQFYDAEMNARVSEKIEIEHALRMAVFNKELFIEYQPKIDMRTGSLTGVEALIRWQHPTLGMISPARFIPIAEENGLILPIGHWLMEHVLAQYREWLDAGIAPESVAINLSVRQFNDQLVPTLRRLLSKYQVDPKRIELEITESLLIKNVDENLLLLSRISALGIRLAIDDFGTGFSSLSYLRRFHLNTIKIDRSFVKDLLSDRRAAAVFMAVLTLAKSLKITVVAEGVENTDQALALREMGCHQSQGFLYGKPMPASELETRFLYAAVIDGIVAHSA